MTLDKSSPFGLALTGQRRSRQGGGGNLGTPLHATLNAGVTASETTAAAATFAAQKIGAGVDILSKYALGGDHEARLCALEQKCEKIEGGLNDLTGDVKQGFDEIRQELRKQHEIDARLATGLDQIKECKEAIEKLYAWVRELNEKVDRDHDEIVVIQQAPPVVMVAQAILYPALRKNCAFSEQGVTGPAFVSAGLANVQAVASLSSGDELRKVLQSKSDSPAFVHSLRPPVAKAIWEECREIAGRLGRSAS